LLLELAANRPQKVIRAGRSPLAPDDAPRGEGSATARALLVDMAEYL